MRKIMLCEMGLFGRFSVLGGAVYFSFISVVLRADDGTRDTTFHFCCSLYLVSFLPT